MKNGSYPNWWKDIEIKEKSNLIISMLCPCGQKKDAYFVHSFLALEFLVYFIIAFFNLPTEYKIWNLKWITWFFLKSSKEYFNLVFVNFVLCVSLIRFIAHINIMVPTAQQPHQYFSNFPAANYS